MKLIFKRVIYFRDSGICLKKIATNEEIIGDLRIYSEEALSIN